MNDEPAMRRWRPFQKPVQIGARRYREVRAVERPNNDGSVDPETPSPDNRGTGNDHS